MRIRRTHLIVAGIVLIAMAGSTLVFGQRIRRIAGDEGDLPSPGGPLPPCVENSMCAGNARSCVSAENTGCCENRDGSCGTANPMTMQVFGGTVTGFRLVRHLDTGTWSTTVGPDRIPLDNFLAAYGEPVFSQVSRNIEGTFPEGGWWQYGLYVTSVTDTPRLYDEKHPVIVVGGFVSEFGTWWEYVKPENLVARERVSGQGK